MSTQPIPSAPGQRKRRAGAVCFFTGTKLIGAALTLPLSRRVRVGVAISGLAVSGYGAYQWLTGKHEAAVAATPSSTTTKEVKAQRSKEE